MKKLTRVAIAGLMFISFHAFSAVPQKILEAPIPLTDGEVTSLEEFKGKQPVYLKFWATWCQPCRQEMPHFQSVQEKYGEKIKIIAINLGINDSPEQVREAVSRYGLTMDIAYDKTGGLAQKFKFIGTPYHLVFDQNMNLVHRGHEANASLDNKLELLSKKTVPDSIPQTVFDEDIAKLTIANVKSKPTGLFFTATWCDWYLVDTRPEDAKNCEDSQNAFNKLVKQQPELNWQIVVSHLWTAEKDLQDYNKKYQINVPSHVDTSNKTFLEYDIKTFPTLVIVDKNKELYRDTTIGNTEEISNLISRL